MIPSRRVCLCAKYEGLVAMIWNNLGFFRIIWVYLGLFGIFWDCLRLIGIV